MERDFYRFLTKLTPDDRHHALTTFLHLNDDDELDELYEAVVSERQSRRKRSGSSGNSNNNTSSKSVVQSVARNRSTPPVVLKCSTPSVVLNRSTPSVQPYKRLRVSPVTSTPVNKSPARHVTPKCRPKDLIASLLDGKHESDVAKQESAAEAEQTVNPIPEEDEEEFLMNSEDDAIASMAYDASYGVDATKESEMDQTLTQSEVSRNDSITENTSAEPGIQSLPESELCTVGTFHTGRKKKKEIVASEQALKLAVFQ